MKNTFAKLRRTLKALKEKLDTANKTTILATQEIERLKSAIDLQQSQINFLNSKLILETKAKQRIKLKLVATKRQRDKNYKLFIDETNKDKCSKWMIGIIVFVVVFIPTCIALLIKW